MSNEKPFLSVVIPAYNEQKRIGKTLGVIHQYLSQQTYSYEVLIIDDGSADQTTKIVEQANFPNTSVLRYEENRGKGFAVNYGMEHATGQYLLMCDADNATPFDQLERLLEYVPEYKVVIGSRYFKNSRANENRTIIRVMVAKITNALVRFLLLPGIKDTQCGFKLFESRAAGQIFKYQTIWGWTFDMEILLIAKKLGYKIKSVNVEWNNAEGSRIQSPMVFLNSLLELIRIKIKSMMRKYE